MYTIFYKRFIDYYVIFEICRYIKAHGENFGKRLATLAFQVEWCKRKNVIVPVGFGLVVVVDVVEVAAGGVRVFGRPQDVRGDLVD